MLKSLKPEKLSKILKKSEKIKKMGEKFIWNNYFLWKIIIYKFKFKIMASITELKNVLKETLEERGVMSQIRARIRAEIFNSLNDNAPDKPEVTIGYL